MSYKTIENIKEYVQKMISDGEQILLAVKSVRVFARPGNPREEQIISWSVDSDGNPLIEKVGMVSEDETGTPDWVVTKIDDSGNSIIDANGNMNQWIIRPDVFRRKYKEVPGATGIFEPVGELQKFICAKEGIRLVREDGEWFVDAGGFINITNSEDIYVVSKRDFEDIYKIIKRE